MTVCLLELPQHEEGEEMGGGDGGDGGVGFPGSESALARIGCLVGSRKL
jgi:hypothetical protein